MDIVGEATASACAFRCRVGSPWYVMVELAAAHPSVPLREMLEDTLGRRRRRPARCIDAALADNEAQRATIWRIRED